MLCALNVSGYGEVGLWLQSELSSFVKWSQASGAMWLHMLLTSGFNDHRSFPFTQLRRHSGLNEWARREMGFDNAKELKAFVSRKVSESDKYDEALEKMEENQSAHGEWEYDKEGIHCQHCRRVRL
jgi:hypothetical protein